MAVLRALPLTPGSAADALLPALTRVLRGRGDPLVAVPAGAGAAPALRVGEPIGDEVAVVAATSGTTGAPKGALLTAAALTASATATHDRLGGPGRWLLALPAHHIAGLQVLVRSVLAGTTPVELDVSAGFEAARLPAAVAALGTAPRRYTALVAAQLAKALTDPAATAALAGLDAVLLGGGPAPPAVLAGAAAAGIPVVRTYGMSETAGGCVYDGVALDGVAVRLAEGRVVIGGATLAVGYRNPTEPDPFAEPGWFHTDDVGALDESGRLQILGRVDDAISTGGLTVQPQLVEAALATHPGVADCAVFGVGDDRLGQQVAAAVVVASGQPAPTLEALRAHVTAALDATAAPRRLHFVAALPRRGIGKLDRAALARRFGGR